MQLWRLRGQCERLPVVFHGTEGVSGLLTHNSKPVIGVRGSGGPAKSLLVLGYCLGILTILSQEICEEHTGRCIFPIQLNGFLQGCDGPGPITAFCQRFR